MERAVGQNEERYLSALAAFHATVGLNNSFDPHVTNMVATQCMQFEARALRDHGKAPEAANWCRRWTELLLNQNVLLGPEDRKMVEVLHAALAGTEMPNCRLTDADVQKWSKQLDALAFVMKRTDYVTWSQFVKRINAYSSSTNSQSWRDFQRSCADRTLAERGVKSNDSR
jgi:hypothetical protein